MTTRSDMVWDPGGSGQKGLTAAALLSAWEAGERRRPLDRGIVMLWIAGLEGDIAALPLAERDRRLLALRQATFGGQLTALTQCPECNAALEIELETQKLAEALVAPEPVVLKEQGMTVELRALNSGDLAAASDVPESDVAAFLRRRLTGVDNLPAPLCARLDAMIEERESACELSISLECADCGVIWIEVLDVVDFIWSEVAVVARRIMGEVAEIATAFGWSERDILAMGAVRRGAYLGLARGG